MSDYTPGNDLERALVQGREGQLELVDFIKIFLGQDIYVLSGSEIQEDGSGFTPLLYDHPETGEKMVTCFSSPARITDMHAEKAPFMLPVEAGQFLQRLTPGLGIVMNPGQAVGFELRPDVIASLVASIRAKRAH